jgi:tRNA(Ile)-lysidine synthase
MGVPNIVLPAEWETKPSAGDAIEEAARKARYKALWRGVWEHGPLESADGGTQTLMFAHHADDQLETAIMRTMRGTGVYGMGGMRAVRRWGMGDEGLRGMRTWICRPLLSVSKVSRVL